MVDEKSYDPLAEFRRVNVDGTAALARQAAAAGVRRFVFVSSIKVNGEFTLPGLPFMLRIVPLLKIRTLCLSGRLSKNFTKSLRQRVWRW